MRRAVLIVTLLACAVKVQAQGTIQFAVTLTGGDEVPPNNDPTVATGTFSLTGNSLSFQVNVPALTFNSVSGFIQGPALPGANAPVIFDLGGPVFHAGSPQFGIPPYYAFFSPFGGTFGAGPFALTPGQIAQLEAGLWYVNITSETMAAGQVRGQILGVPEPSVCACLILGGAIAAAARLRKHGGGARSRSADTNILSTRSCVL